ncbi:LysR substrate-binding domain-containing protein [Diaphorobacter ruginosibacter]|uniref:LysR substrate-binding domain-containing protein n=1 Tax=Diaphorobacter ruginosibacter TaxID=1715720 RepID=UPI00333E4549
MAKRTLPPLKTLRAFEAAARHANFTAAADELSITHSAVSQQIRLLEEYLDRPLFAREARGVVLLPHARAYFQEVQACLDRISTATHAVKSPSAPRILRVCTTPSLAMKWLIPRLSEFQEWEPGVDVQLTTVNRRFIEQADASSDVVILRFPLQRPEHACVRVMDDFLIPVASPRFMQRHDLRAPADCLGHPLLQVTGCVDDWPHWFGLAGLEVPTQLPGPMFDHHFLCVQAAMNDLGIALVPWCMVEEDLQGERLRTPFAQPRLTGAGVYALYKTDGAAAAAAKRFADWLAAVAMHKEG